MLEEKYNITRAVYHGGSLILKDVQKVIQNATDIIMDFADVLMAKHQEG